MLIPKKFIEQHVEFLRKQTSNNEKYEKYKVSFLKKQITTTVFFSIDKLVFVNNGG